MHDDPTSRANLKDTKRKLIIRRLHQVLKEAQDDVAIGTGFERKGRWQARVSAKGGQTGTEELVANGNVANAIAAATTQSAKDSAKRLQIFRASKAPALECLSAARVTSTRPLVLGDYLFIFADDKIQIGQVITLYEKPGGKNAKNHAVSTTGNICGLSRVSVQVFEYSHGRQFTSKPTASISLNVHQFLHLPPCFVLTLLASKPQTINVSGFSLSPVDMTLFATLIEGLPAIKKAMKAFKKRKLDILFV
ncbi:hypothetical protein CVT25_015703 [Psilocybe cyanescens]|uniref:Uncharacterized protein n=1 Tax=Psilocybe cyanescens TaxID=93625 RepID=A0A409WDR2_PSICY|nr:hypothetical protein CVT25_015703 [Psilocybe cyanescens]